MHAYVKLYIITIKIRNRNQSRLPWHYIILLYFRICLHRIECIKQRMYVKCKESSCFEFCSICITVLYTYTPIRLFCKRIYIHRISSFQIKGVYVGHQVTGTRLIDR